MENLLMPFQVPFMQNAFLIVTIIAPAAAMLSCFLVLKGWSLMGDAIAHAVSDALLGAAGLGDIGEHFPDSDPQWKGADSMQILRQVVDKVRAAGWRVENVDVNVICERPKIAPHRAAMQANLVAAVGAPVSVKGRRAEGLGSIGRVEGIACMAVALLVS